MNTTQHLASTAALRSVPTQETEEPTRELGVVWLNEIDELPLPEYQVMNLIPVSSIGMIFGPMSMGKSFIALDLCLSLATGQPFMGREIMKQTKPLYVYAEGERGLRGRKRAWEIAHDITLADYAEQGAFIPRSLNLAPLELGPSEHLAQLARLVEQHGFGHLLIDTLSANTPGMREDNESYAELIYYLRERIVEPYGCNVTIVAHTPKGRADEVRGGYAIEANTDWSLNVEKQSGMRIKKQRDGAGDEWIPLKRHIIDTGLIDAHGRPITSLSIQPTETVLRHDPGMRALHCIDVLREEMAENPGGLSGNQWGKAMLEKAKAGLAEYDLLKGSRNYVEWIRKSCLEPLEQGDPFMTEILVNVASEKQHPKWVAKPKQ